MKKFMSILMTLLTCSSILIVPIGINNKINVFNQQETPNYSLSDGNDIKHQEDRSVNFNYFSGTATTISTGTYVSSYYYYHGQKIYYRFYCQIRQCIRFNYSGPNASLRIFYSNFFTDSDCVTSVQNINNAVDCYLFDQDVEYIIELSTYNISSMTPFHFQMTTLTLSTLSNHTKYVFHQVFDFSNNVGYHYEIQYFDVSETTYTGINCELHSYSSSTSYADEIDSYHWFYDPNTYSFADNRRVVVDTGFDEYSAIAFSEGSAAYNSYTQGYSNSYLNFTGTFVSESLLVSCAHSIFPHLNNDDEEMVCTGELRYCYFWPGINNYTYSDYYGKYIATELYASISYVLQFYMNNEYTFDCAKYDWSIVKTLKIENGIRTHSCMGLSGFSYPTNLDCWSYARSAGYPNLKSHPNDGALYLRTLWASYPLENDVVIVNGKVESNSSTNGAGIYVSNGKQTILFDILSAIGISVFSL